MARSSRFCVVSTIVLVALIATVQCRTSILLAQTGKSKSRPTKPLSATEAKQIDARLEKLQETFATETTSIIDSYERSGQYERAKFLVEVLVKLDPKNETLRKKISDLDEKILDRTEFDQKFNSANDWTLIGTVQKDKAARIEASGEYKLSLPTTSVGPDGFPTEDMMHDLVGRVPTGALMGMIVTEEHKKDKKAPDPFAIKSKHDFTPKNDGELYLKVNVPPGSKCTGDLKLKLNGVSRGNP